MNAFTEEEEKWLHEAIIYNMGLEDQTVTEGAIKKQWELKNPTVLCFNFIFHIESEGINLACANKAEALAFIIV